MKTRSTLRSAAPLQPRSVAAPADLVGGLKKTLGQRLAQEFRQCVPVVLIRRAIDDAAELAGSTDFPHLFLPALAEEKVRLISTALCDEPATAEMIRSAA